MSIISSTFSEQLRPQTLEQALLVDRVRNQLTNELNSQYGIVSSLLFYGVQGTGKTTLSRIMAKGHDVKPINCSAVGIDAVREDIQTFASHMSLEHDNPIKIVLLEECDGFTPEAWKAMRAVVEAYSDTVRFIANCNYIEKVPAPIRSRFTCIQLEPLDNAEREQLFGLYKQRCAAILTKLGIAYTDETLDSLVSETFPDFRSIVNKIQQLYISGVKELTTSVLVASTNYDKLFDIMLKGQQQDYDTYVMVRDEYGDNIDACISQIGSKFPEYLRKVAPEKLNKLPLILIAVAKYQDMLYRAINRNIPLEALVFETQMILRS